MTAPAIRTRYDERYRDIQSVKTVGSDLRFVRGFGEVGTSVEVVRLDEGCPFCGEQEMVLSRDLNPEGHDDAVFYCTSITCPHFVGDEVEYDMDRIRADKPQIWDNTAECPDCGARHTVEVARHGRLHDKANEGSSCIIDEPCDDCKVTVGTA